MINHSWKYNLVNIYRENYRTKLLIGHFSVAVTNNISSIISRFAVEFPEIPIEFRKMSICFIVESSDKQRCFDDLILSALCNCMPHSAS